MLVNFFYGLPVIVLCFLIQSLLLIIAMSTYRKRLYKIDRGSIWTSFFMINEVLILLIIGNLIQIAIWAILFQSLGEFANFSTAVYHSAVNFSTLGYGDIVMSEERRFLGPLESINGVLMIGVSTAALMAVLQDAMKRTFKARKHRDDD